MKRRYFVLCLLLVCVLASFMTGKLPSKVYALPDEISVNSRAAILVDYFSGEVLHQQNADQKFEVASMVKLMTIYLTIDALENGQIALDDTLVASEYAASHGGSQVFLDAGSSYNVGKMLQSVIMASANDASVALAEFVAGSEKAFVEKMNQTAKALGMENTQYANATGLPAPMQFSTAADTVKILSKLIPNETYHKFSSMWMDELVHPSGRKTEIVNTNKLTCYYKGCDSGKTGFTDEAGYCLASSVMRDDMRLVAVVMGAKTAKERFSESINLFNWGFSNFKNNIILDCSEAVGEVNVVRSLKTSAKVFAKECFSAVTPVGKAHEYEIKFDIQKSAKAPMNKGDVVGVAVVSKKGLVVKEVELVLGEDIAALTYPQAIGKVAKAW